MTLEQVQHVSAALADGPPAFVSVFAGRIADTGRDPLPIMAAAVELLRMYPNVELIWASPRELLNIFQLTALAAILLRPQMISWRNYGWWAKTCAYSLETVKMFRDDAVKAGYTL